MSTELERSRISSRDAISRMDDSDFAALDETQQAATVREIKQLAMKNQKHRNLMYFAAAVFGFAGGAVWVLLIDTTASYETAFSIALICGLAVAGFAQSLLLKPQARCPSCGHDWEVKEGEFVKDEEKMQLWLSCPGCGICMARGTGRPRQAMIKKPARQ